MNFIVKPLDILNAYLIGCEDCCDKLEKCNCNIREV